MKPERSKQEFDPFWIDEGYGTRIQSFQNLMRWRIRDVLLVSSLYDLYLFEEDGRLYELIRNEYQGLHLSHSPELTRVSRGQDALTLAKDEKRFDLVITTLHIEDMTALRLARLMRDAGLDTPIVLLAYDNRELNDLLTHHDTSVFDRVFIWQGDFRLIIAIIKQIEDTRNIDRDTRVAGVQSIILVEDNIRFYSSFLPIIYSEILNHSQRLILEGINLSDKYLRMRARPKILLCTTYDEAWQTFQKYEDHILGVISDVDFQHHGRPDSRAGIEFAKNVKARHPDIPILLQSTTAKFEAQARMIATSFLLKNSPTLLHDLRQFIVRYFSFGDFVFRTPDGREVGRATDLKSLEEQLQHVPEESILYHGERNHFSNWLKARTEFGLAHELRPRKVSDYPSVQALRDNLISSLREYRRLRQRGTVMDFRKETFLPSSSFARIGGGSLGGKARGLSFVNILINTYDLREKFPGVQIFVPPAVVIGTDVFDQFMDENDLRSFSLNTNDDSDITRHFLEAGRFPTEVAGELENFLDLIRSPLAVRSSSLLEDSQYHPFAGVYATYMIPNNNPDPSIRLRELLNTIKRVYASMFYRTAKDYIKVTSFRLEEEKMAVIIQKMVGARHEDRFYPDFAGVARSYNFYPVPPQEPLDGIASVALGLGKTIVEGGSCVRFCPRYPHHLIQFHSTDEALATNQHEFYALQLDGNVLDSVETWDTLLTKHPLNTAEEDGTLQYVGSTYSPADDTISDGLSRKGPRLVTFSPVLRHKLLPLPQIIDFLLELGSWGMGTPVEIEFAATMSVSEGKPKEFGLVQMRPLALTREMEELTLNDVSVEQVLVSSDQVLGNGVTNDIHDIVVVDIHKFDRSRTHLVAREVSLFNAKMIEEGRSYLLVGVGRWGSLDPWLGIPIKWEQICGARAIIETGFKDLDVTPSQGSHFFQNIISFQVGYFTINPTADQGFIDWDWLLSRKAIETREFTSHLRFDRPLTMKINGHSRKGIILKPDEPISGECDIGLLGR